ncbi:hypothetical protein [Candidatus Amarolinea dominans]|uniref:hypothetical protein n=1 Tax=Candidatus Amarolinea dominans TaxID=3140696 RepID=UPI0031346624|nr:hypothetical protein [Anaerolineae bacterium]
MVRLLHLTARRPPRTPLAQSLRQRVRRWTSGSGATLTRRPVGQGFDAAVQNSS